MGKPDFVHLIIIIVFLSLSNCGIRGDLRIEIDPIVSAESEDKLDNHYSLLENPLVDNLSEAKEHKGNVLKVEQQQQQQQSSSLTTKGKENHQAPSGIEIMRSSTLINLTGDPSPGSGKDYEKKEEVIHFVLKNVGTEDEVLHVNVSDEKGFVNQSVPSSQFYLSSGSSTEISVQMIYPPNNDNKHNNDTLSNSPDVITIEAKGKGNTVKRSAYYYYPGSDYEYSQQYQPFCYDRYVTGNCRYRTDPYNCDQYKWTAYSTIQSSGGIQQLRSIPEGLYIPPEFQPGTRDRIRVYLTVSCCIPIVQFISVNPYHPNVGNACIVDVRELQWLHPGEIAGIVIAAIALVVIIIVIIALAIKRRRNDTILVGHTAAPAHTSSSRD